MFVTQPITYTETADEDLLEAVSPASIRPGRVLHSVAWQGAVITRSELVVGELWFYSVGVALPGGGVDPQGALWIAADIDAGVLEGARLWRRKPKPAKATVLTIASDGSWWIYPANRDGTYLCFYSGSEAIAGEFSHWGGIPGLQSGSNIAPIADAQWDWELVTNGALVEVGDVVLFGVSELVTVDHINVTADEHGRTWDFMTAGEAVLMTVIEDGSHLPPGAVESLYQVVDRPAFPDLFVGVDGSEWIYMGDDAGTFMCYSDGSNYRAGAAFLRAHIIGGLIDSKDEVAFYE